MVVFSFKGYKGYEKEIKMSIETKLDKKTFLISPFTIL